MQINHLRIAKHFVREGKQLCLNSKKDHFLLIYTASGGGCLSMNHEISRLAAGEIVYAADGVKIMNDSNQVMACFVITWAGTEIRKNNHFISAVRAMPLLDEWLVQQQQNSSAAIYTCYSFFYRFLALAAEQGFQCSIQECAALIAKQLDEPWPVSKLAAQAGMTPSAFTRAFRRKLGCSPTQFLQKERMRQAKKWMVQNKQLTLKEVGAEIGIHDEFYFSRLFKKSEGVAPSLFLKRLTPRIAVVSQLMLQDHVLALGIQPVAAPFYPTVFPGENGLPSYLAPLLEGTKRLNAENRFSYEEVLQTEPDIIIKTALHENEENIIWTQHESTAVLPLQQKWDWYLDEIAALTGKEKQAEQVKNRIGKLEEEARNMLAPQTRSGRWAIIWVRANEIRLYGRSAHACMDLFFETLQFQPHGDLPEQGYRSITVEDLVRMQPERLLILWSTPCDVQKVCRHPSWKSLHAVKKGHVYMPDSLEWDAWGPLGRAHMLEELTAYFQKGIYLSM